jgi:hypothetical protein
MLALVQPNECASDCDIAFVQPYFDLLCDLDRQGELEAAFDLAFDGEEDGGGGGDRAAAAPATVKVAEIEMSMALTFEEPLAAKEIEEVCGAIELKTAEDTGVSVEQVACDMVVDTGMSVDARRRLLSTTYDTSITVTVPESEQRTIGAIAEIDPEAYESAIAALPVLAEANGDAPPTVELLETVITRDIEVEVEDYGWMVSAAVRARASFAGAAMAAMLAISLLR